MNFLRFFLYLCVAAVLATAQENASPTLHPFTVIRAGTLIDGKSDSPRHNQVIVIRGNRIESISDACRCEDSRRRRRDRSLPRDRTARSDRFPHPHLPAGRRPRAGRIRHQHPEVSAGPACSRATVSRAPRTGAGIHHAARPRNRRRRLRRRRHQAGHRGRLHSRAAAVHRHPRDFDDRRLPARRLRARTRHAEGSATQSTARSRPARRLASNCPTAPTGSRST